MASACLNNVAMCPSPSSFTKSSMDFEDLIDLSSTNEEIMNSNALNGNGIGNDRRDSYEGDFEFRLDLDYPVQQMLAADELFSEGKLVPLVPPALPEVKTAVKNVGVDNVDVKVGVSRTSRSSFSGVDGCRDPYLFSPKAPRCSSRWKELLGLKKTGNGNGNVIPSGVNRKLCSVSNQPSSLKHFLHRNPKASSGSGRESLSLPLLRDSELESSGLGSGLVSRSGSISSSSSSGDDIVNDRIPPPPRVRLVKQLGKKSVPNGIPAWRSVNENKQIVVRNTMRNNNRMPPDSNARGGVTIDSPRMNSSGKVVFQSLERSSSSPSTFNGGPRVKHKGMERSYSANVRVRPVLNVGVGSLRGSSKTGSVFGFGQLFSAPQKKDGASANSTRSSSNSNRQHRSERV